MDGGSQIHGWPAGWTPNHVFGSPIHFGGTSLVLVYYWIYSPYYEWYFPDYGWYFFYYGSLQAVVSIFPDNTITKYYFENSDVIHN